MGFDANGNYTRKYGVNTWAGDAAAGTKILSGRHDENDNDMAMALSDCLNRRGQGVPLTNISWGGMQLKNLGTPTALNDAVNKDYVDTLPGWAKSKYIDGTDVNGRLNFTGDSGVNGIGWQFVNLAWVAKKAKVGETPDRLVMANTWNPPATGNANDVFFIDRVGRINNNGQLTNNLSYDSPNWRVISPGFGCLLQFTGGDFVLSSNDVATITNPYVTAVQRVFFGAANQAGSSLVQLFASASGKSNGIMARVGSNPSTNARWIMYMGDGAAETGGGTGRGGSNFSLYAYDNNGANAVLAMRIDRGLGKALFYGDLYASGQFQVDGVMYADILENYSGLNLYLRAKANGTIALRPDADDTTKQLTVYNTGGIALCNGAAAATGGIQAGQGIRGKLGSAGAYDTEYMNFSWNGTNLIAYANTSSLGNVTVSCDHRIKKDILPLPSMWDRVKALKPISYTQKAYEIWTDDSTERWGFLAHELQDTLTPSAATGAKDGPEVQAPNLLALVAGLTRALQEAMARIEALEGAA